jgi:hypothetical protein
MPEYADETKQHVVQQLAPIHGWACQHPVVAVLSRVKQFMEILPVYGMNTLAVEPEQAQGQYQLNRRYAVMFLQRQTVKQASKAKTAKQRQQINTHLTFSTQKLGQFRKIH